MTSSKGPGPTRTSSSLPSPTKAVDPLDITDMVDPLQQFWKHYLPDEVEMEEPDEDSRAISEIELEYLGVASTWEDWHRGEYGNVPTYHTILSPLGANEDNNSMLEGSMVEILPETEASLLQMDDTGKD